MVIQLSHVSQGAAEAGILTHPPPPDYSISPCCHWHTSESKTWWRRWQDVFHRVGILASCHTSLSPSHSVLPPRGRCGDLSHMCVDDGSNVASPSNHPPFMPRIQPPVRSIFAWVLARSASLFSMSWIAYPLVVHAASCSSCCQGLVSCIAMPQPLIQVPLHLSMSMLIASLAQLLQWPNNSILKSTATRKVDLATQILDRALFKTRGLRY
jgi:hypothetical protein